MQLCYRGVPYECNPTSVKTIKGEVGGKYRGLPWQHTHVKLNKGLRVQSSYDLYYRGVTPQCQPHSQLNGIPVTESNSVSSF